MTWLDMMTWAFIVTPIVIFAAGVWKHGRRISPLATCGYAYRRPIWRGFTPVYVGIADDDKRRHRQHRNAWWAVHARHRTERWFATRSGAKRWETRMIRRHGPRLANEAQNPTPWRGPRHRRRHRTPGHWKGIV